MSIGTRIKEARLLKKLTQKQLADKVRVKQPTLSQLESGKSEGSTLIASFATALGVSAYWLETGKGERELSKILQSNSSNVATSNIGLRKIPIISYIQAGLMSEHIDIYSVGESYDYLLTDLEVSSNAFALEIKGDSMLPEFKEGDKVIIDPTIEPRPSDFVVAKNGQDEATFKKYRPRSIDESGKEIFELTPLNDDYPIIRSDVVPMVIIGVMVEHRKYRKN